MVPKPANPKGYFEDNDIYLCNDQVLLPALGGKWHSLSPVDWSVLGAAARSRLELQALEIIRRNYPSSKSLCVLKEPRISTLLPFWLPVLQQAGFDVRLIGVVRDPLSVARSLQQRDGFSLTLGGMLYLTTWYDVLQHTGERQLALISFEDLLASPGPALGRLTAELRITLPADFKSRTDIFASAHLDQSLCHSRVKLQDLALEPELAAKVVETFALLFPALCFPARNLLPATSHRRPPASATWIAPPVFSANLKLK